MSNVKTFNDTEFGQLEILIIDGKEYFPATDCARMLGYSNPQKAIRDHCKAPGITKRSVGVQTGVKADGTPAMQYVEKNFITEGNLYRLITNSNLPSAERFESWVFDDVLPTIRKNGSYEAETVNARTDFGEIASIMREFRMWAAKQKMPYNQAMACMVKFLHTTGVPFPEEMVYQPPLDINAMQLAMDFMKQNSLA